MGDDNKKENPQEFSFLRENIKEKPLNKKKLLYMICMMSAFAILFGTIAAAAFVYVQPKAQKFFYPEKPDKVTFPEDTDDQTQEEDKPDEVEQVVIQEKVSLELSDYEMLFNKMSILSAESARSLVVVNSATSKTDWFDEMMENTDHGSGVLIADNGLEYLILTEYRLVKDANYITCTFADGSIEEAKIKEYDGNTGFAVLSVSRSSISQETKEAVSIAELGNSNLIKNGAPILVIGSPASYQNTVLFGNITSHSNYIKTSDANYRVLTTSVVGSTTGSGVLINLEGEVIGILASDERMETFGPTLSAYAISDLKRLIEKLSNGEEIGYMGIIGTDVTTTIAERTKVPKGVYVQIVMDSPAMLSGIQNGDIITAINNRPIDNMKAVQNILLEFDPEQAVNLTVMRQGKDAYTEMKYVVTLGKMR